MSYTLTESFCKRDSISLAPIPWIHPATKVHRSAISGKGIFATENICEGDVVFRCGGQLFRNNDIHDGKARLQSLTGFAEGVYIGTPSDAPKGTDEYLNHSCDPNLWLLDEITLVARRSIRIGEELTVDYSTWEIDEHWKLPGICNCKSLVCRGRITGKDWIMDSLQSRYMNHFLPCLNERMAKQMLSSRPNHFFQKIVRHIATGMNHVKIGIQRRVQEVSGSLEVAENKIIRRVK
jgi:hypothetical protein